MNSLVLLVACLGLAVSAKRYDGYEILQVTPSTTAQVGYLHHLRDNFDFMREIAGVDIPVQIAVSPGDISFLKAFLSNAEISFTVISSDYQKNIDLEKRLNDEALEKARQEGRAGMEWTAYHSYAEIMAFCDDLAAANPSIVTSTVVGSSFEGREMKLVKISNGDAGHQAMFIDGGIHAREWISPATVTYFMNELVTNHREALDTVDFYFMPLINPDGYQFSIDEDRNWRKTRSYVDEADLCYGCDPNRNWDYMWGAGGTSSSRCSDIYKGESAFSEVEMRAVRDQMIASGSTIYLTYHSYGLMMLWPWGYDDIRVDDWEDLDTLGKQAEAAIQAVYGTGMVVANSGEYYGAAAGASDDYAKSIGIKYSYTIELRPKGSPGFVLPPDEIIPNSIEQWAGFEVFYKSLA